MRTEKEIIRNRNAYIKARDEAKARFAEFDNYEDMQEIEEDEAIIDILAWVLD